MAGTVVHLVIADRLLDTLHIENPALFYCGNLAPDAIMARQNYQRSMKTHTHFKDGQHPYEFRIKENQAVYHERFMEFFNSFLKDNNGPDRELFLGYVVHMLVDELYLLEYYEDFLVELNQKGISPADETFSKSFVHDVDQVDWELVRTYKFKYPMPDILFKEDGYEIPGWITAEELLSSKLYIVWKNFQQEHEKEPLQVATFQRNYDYIESCVEKIPVILKERFGMEF